MDETAVLNADKRKKAADAVCLVFDMLVLALVVWMALPALDAYTSAGIVRPGAVPETERLLETDGAASVGERIPGALRDLGVRCVRLGGTAGVRLVLRLDIERRVRSMVGRHTGRSHGIQRA